MSDSKTYTIKLPTPEEAFEMNQRAHAERLQAARDEAEDAERMLYDHFAPGSTYDAVDMATAIAKLIDAKIELALLERGGG